MPKRNLDETNYQVSRPDVTERMDNTIIRVNPTNANLANDKKYQNLVKKQLYNQAELFYTPLRYIPYAKYATSSIDLMGLNPKGYYDKKYNNSTNNSNDIVTNNKINNNAVTNKISIIGNISNTVKMLKDLYTTNKELEEYQTKTAPLYTYTTNSTPTISYPLTIKK